MFKRDVWRYGAVDVRDSSGLVRHGLIRDLSHRGHFLVDFDCPQQHRVTVPISQCLAWRRRRGGWAVGAPMLTLLRSAPDQPWQWFPATMLAYSSSDNGYAFVEVDVAEGDKRQEVVCLDRVKHAPPGADWGELRRKEQHATHRGSPCVNRYSDKFPFEPDLRYWKYRVSLPLEAGLRQLAGRGEFREWWGDATRTILLRVKNGRLTYLSSTKGAMTKADCAAFLQRIAHSLTRVADQDGSKGLFRLASGPTEHSKAAMSDKEAFVMPWESVPYELIVDIFTCLDVDERIACRLVCAHWNAVIEELPTSTVCICPAKHREEKLALALHRTVGADTKILVITRAHHDNEVQDCFLHTVISLLAVKGISVPLIVLAQTTLMVSNLWRDPGWLKAPLNWSSVCRRFIMLSVEVRVVRRWGSVEDRRRQMLGLMQTHYGLEKYEWQLREPDSLLVLRVKKSDLVSSNIQSNVC
ncbi:uncharacterized protein LOC129590898 [Paramacrobiotus metropolitanus]|uniref:uncharacterized protein LOC129590898 n=1 Tax=Paramacrobiotus metropolitanus TaxID=2943436 RepID=UPI002445C8A5|nr:uncharacterized protein LOC129590898 [Paramacrobiotus metropolitanus]